ncbi:hypothetical protein [Sphingomonas sp. MS122]|uniref:hypothetical protein n=1 Tax=Sphingomonas sp. MS122 TaxID=3412683 RepID=UPI003C2FAD54
MSLSIAVALTLSLSTPLLMGLFAIWPEVAKSDLAVRVMFGIACLLLPLLLGSGLLLSAGGLGYLGLVKAVILLAGAFALAGIGFGLVRGLRSGRRAHTA